MIISETPIEKELDLFEEGFIDSQEDLDPEFKQILDDNFWELL